jgi:hypothetical protein
MQTYCSKQLGSRRAKAPQDQHTRTSTVTNEKEFDELFFKVSAV